VSFEISHKPEFPLNNFLLDLAENDGVGNSLYLYGIENSIKDLWKEIMERKKKINVRKVFPKELGLEPTHFYAILKGKRGISIKSSYRLITMWKEYCNKTIIDMNRKWDDVYDSDFLIASFSKPGRITLPKNLTPKLSYLMGWIVGDGCFDSNGNHYRLKISETMISQLENVLKPIFFEIFNTKPWVRNEGSGRDNSNFIIVHSKPIFRFFRNVLGLKVGEVPQIIKDVPKVQKRFFIRGVFDSEGDVSANYKGSRVRISQKSRLFLEDIMEILDDVGISANGPYGPFFRYPYEKFKYFSKWHYLEIRKKSEILKFAERIGSSHLKKAPKMSFLANEIRNKYKYISH
jgi:hypothetical protein